MGFKVGINLDIITDRHPSPLFSVRIISPNAERKIMQTSCVRKTGAVFFGSMEIIWGNLKRAKSTRSIIETRGIIHLKQAALLEIMLRVLVLIMQHALHAYTHFPHISFY